jgi:hypothetical protein
MGVGLLDLAGEGKWQPALEGFMGTRLPSSSMKEAAWTHLIINVFRPSSTDKSQTSLYGPSRDYKSEEWLLDYFYVDENESVNRKRIGCFLPLGYEAAFLRYGDPNRKEGPVYKVRAWGAEFSARYVSFCEDYVRVRNQRAKTRREIAEWDLLATGWDLPGYYTIASDEHPFTVISPGGHEFVYDYWSTAGQAVTQIRETKAAKTKRFGRRKEKDKGVEGSS